MLDSIRIYSITMTLNVITCIFLCRELLNIYCIHIECTPTLVYIIWLQELQSNFHILLFKISNVERDREKMHVDTCACLYDIIVHISLQFKEAKVTLQYVQWFWRNYWIKKWWRAPQKKKEKRKKEKLHNITLKNFM